MSDNISIDISKFKFKNLSDFHTDKYVLMSKTPINQMAAAYNIRIMLKEFYPLIRFKIRQGVGNIVISTPILPDNSHPSKDDLEKIIKPFIRTGIVNSFQIQFGFSNFRFEKHVLTENQKSTYIKKNLKK